MREQRARYIPALRYRWLTPLYDATQRWLMRESTIKGRLVRGAGIAAGHRVLDLGCGTATLTVLAKESHPGAEVVGLDGDQGALKIARRKAARAGVAITFEHGLAFALPYPDGSFDRVLSSLVLHHLTADDKRRALAEVFRVLRPGGELHLADICRPRGLYARLASFVIRRFEEAADNIRGLLPGMLSGAGFDPVIETGAYTTLVGTIALYRALKRA